MYRFLKISVYICVFILCVGLFTIYAAPSSFNQVIYPLTECNDGIDNDGDGFIDYAFDPDCISWEDNNESPEVITEPDNPPQDTNNQTDKDSPPRKNQIGSNVRATPQPESSRDDLESENRNIFAKFLWEPLATVLGLSAEKSLVLSEITEANINNIFIFLSIYVIISLIIIIVYKPKLFRRR